MPIDDKEKENPDLKGFDLEAMADLGAWPDGSGGGIHQLAWEMKRLRELRERAALLEAFIRKHQLVLARLSWSLDDTVLHPTKKQGEDNEFGVFVPQIALTSHAYDKRHKVEPREIAALWPNAQWRRSMPRWGKSDTERDYTADVEGVLIRIKDAERLPPARPIDRFPPCGPVSISRMAEKEKAPA